MQKSFSAPGTSSHKVACRHLKMRNTPADMTCPHTHMVAVGTAARHTSLQTATKVPRLTATHNTDTGTPFSSSTQLTPPALAQSRRKCPHSTASHIKRTSIECRVSAYEAASTAANSCRQAGWVAVNLKPRPSPPLPQTTTLSLTKTNDAPR